VGRTKGDKNDHPNANIDFTTTVPVLEDSTSGIDVVGGDNQILEEIVISEGKPDGGVHEAGSISGEATLVWNVGGHFAERNHDEVANKTDETIPEKDAKGTTSARVGFELARRRFGWLEPYRTRAVPDPMMRPVPTAPPREIMEIWGEGEHAPNG
jgi:hypothetical protein